MTKLCEAPQLPGDPLVLPLSYGTFLSHLHLITRLWMGTKIRPVHSLGRIALFITLMVSHRVIGRCGEWRARTGVWFSPGIPRR